MRKTTVLVIEDDAAIRQGIVDALQFGGYAALEASNGTDGLRRACRVEYDLLLLDLMLPGVCGLEILQEVRRHRPTLPIIILTARGSEDDRVEGLQLGADDYVVKPFSARELLARVEAVLRRSPERPSDVAKIDIPGGRVDLARHEVCIEDRPRRELSEREVDLLYYLAANAGRAISREEILNHVWGVDPRGVQTRTIDMHVARLRDKIERDPARPEVIVTVHGKGYKFIDVGAVE